MPPIPRYRKKRTVYLSQADEDAVKLICQRMGLRTKASAIRWAIRDTERRFTRPSATPACLALVEYVETLRLLSDKDAGQLQVLCRNARAELR